MTTAAELRSLVAAGETDRVEFKTDFPPARVTAQNIAALANTDGGQIIFGVREDPQNGTAVITGVRSMNPERRIREALQLLDPQPKVELKHVPTDDGNVFITTVQPDADRPTLAQGIYYTRSGGKTVTANEASILRLVRTHTAAASERQVLEGLAATIGKMNSELVRLRRGAGWPRQALFLLLGAILGTITSEVVDFLKGP